MVAGSAEPPARGPSRRDGGKRLIEQGPERGGRARRLGVGRGTRRPDVAVAVYVEVHVPPRRRPEGARGCEIRARPWTTFSSRWGYSLQDPPSRRRGQARG